MLWHPTAPSEVREGRDGPRRPRARTEWWAGEERPRPEQSTEREAAAPPLGSGRIAWESSRTFWFTRPQWAPLVLPLVPASQGGEQRSGSRGRLWGRWSARRWEGCKAGCSVVRIWAVLVLLSQGTELLCAGSSILPLPCLNIRRPNLPGVRADLTCNRDIRARAEVLTRPPVSQPPAFLTHHPATQAPLGSVHSASRSCSGWAGPAAGRARSRAAAEGGEAANASPGSSRRRELSFRSLKRGDHVNLKISYEN